MKTLDELIKKVRKAKKVDKREFILNYCKGKKVLDVGCVGQDVDMNNELWLHNGIKKVANSLVGVDIQKKGLEIMKENAFDVLHVDELKVSKEKYDLIVMGDVIEHVDSAVEFLKFYKPFLSDSRGGGEMLISTPNFLSAKSIISTLLFNFHSVNEEHTMWLCYKTFFEICNRCEMEIVDFYWIKPLQKIRNSRGWVMKLVLTLSNVLIFFRRTFSENMMFIIKSK